jgi:uncharacterized protein
VIETLPRPSIMKEEKSTYLPLFNPAHAIADETGWPRAGVVAVVELLSAGSTVPFIARYRKEATGGLDEVQIRTVEERNAYLRELHDRKETVLAAIDEQGKLTPELRRSIAGASTKASVEDLFAPYRTRRRTRAVIARERGLQPLADAIRAQPATLDLAGLCAPLLSDDVPTLDEALSGARDILAEEMTELAAVRGHARERLKRSGVLTVEGTDDARKGRTKFEQYYEFSEPLERMPSHRFLAIRRGEKEGMLRTRVELDTDALAGDLSGIIGIERRSASAPILHEALTDGMKRLLMPSVESDVRVELKLRSDQEAVDVFAQNLRSLLLAAPAGGRSVVGVDPGLRTGCKCAALDATGQFHETTTFMIVGDTRRGEHELLSFLTRHKPWAVAVGNGTGGRETEEFVKRIVGQMGSDKPVIISVNEAGASVYSASDVARDEFPELDLTIRGAISIGRRLQDPLAELVKIDPKSIGVGQYQHDVHQPLLQKKLTEVVESCVNHVGVELNTASASLLAHVAGIGDGTAKKIIEFRNTNGAFTSRKELLKVGGIGPRTYEQCAGFLRVAQSKNPLDASAVHPERYKLVEKMAADTGVKLSELVGNEQLARTIRISNYVGIDGVGEPTLADIIDELCKPGRDPREKFEPPAFRDDVQSVADVKTGMILEGVVTNVTAFGAFVDIGVHQDGLVHISQLADRFVRVPSDVVSAGDRLRVRVLEVDYDRQRIALSARLEAPVEADADGGNRDQGRRQAPERSSERPRRNDARPAKQPQKAKREDSFAHTPFAALLKK